MPLRGGPFFERYLIALRSRHFLNAGGALLLNFDLLGFALEARGFHLLRALDGVGGRLEAGADLGHAARAVIGARYHARARRTRHDRRNIVS